MKKYILLAIIFGWSGFVGAQTQSLTLGFCYSEAVNNLPQLKDREILQTVSELRIKNLSVNYLPQISVNGQATYQSDAIDFTKQIGPNTFSIKQSKDQYKATVDVNQLIYDGGATKWQKQLENAAVLSDVQQVDADAFKIKEQVNALFFGILLYQENKKVLKASLEDIAEKQKTVKSAVAHGALTPSDDDLLEAERLIIEQTLAELEINRLSTLKILSIYLNKSLSDSTQLQLPEIATTDSIFKPRPEVALFDFQQKKLDVSKQVLSSVLKPKVAAFAQAGYGRPGLNMLNSDFSPFYIIGATIKWNVWDWNKSHRDRETLDVQKKLIDNRREQFNRNLAVDLENRMAIILRFEESLRRDSSIVELRKRIVKTSASKLSNGVATSSDYLTDQNAFAIAQLNQQTHQIQLIQAKASYKLASGRN